MELTSIYGEMFKGKVVAEHENVVIAEDTNGVRYTVHRSKLGHHKVKDKAYYLHGQEFDVEGTAMRGVMPKQMDRLVERGRGRNFY